MKRIVWTIGKTVSNAIAVLNTVFCYDDKENELLPDDLHLLMEQINSECSTMMIEDALDFLSTIHNMPSGRFCDNTDCNYHHPDDNSQIFVNKDDFNKMFTEKCADCVRNSKGKEPEMALDHYECT